MGKIFIYAMLVKALILALGILAWFGHLWAFGLFIVVSVMAVLVDILVAIVANSAEKDIERNMEQ